MIELMRALPAVILALLLLTAADTNRAQQDQLWQHRNLGKAFYENPTTQAQAVAEFKKALDLAPGSAREQLNYGLALLRAGKTAEGVAQLEKVQKAHPELPHTWFNLGLTFKKEGEGDRALPQFERMVQLAPDEPVSHYQLGILYKQVNRMDDAVRQFAMAERLNPNLAGPHFQLYNVFRTTGKPEEAARELQQFQQIKKLQEGAAIPEDMEWSEYAEIYDPVEALPPAPAAAMKFTERKVAGTVDPATAGSAMVDGELIVWSAKGVIARRPGLQGLGAVRWISPGDYDNDGRMDLAAVTDRDIQLCHNDKTKFTCSVLLAGDYNGAAWLDFDHDYDLDLFLFGKQSRLMRNQGSAGFADRTADFPFVSQEAVHGEPVRVDPESKSFDLRVESGDGSTVIYRDELNGHYRADSHAKVEPEHPDGQYAVFGADGSVTERIPQLPASWIGVRLEGVRNLKLAQGSYVEVKAGQLYLRKRYNGEPLVFDLRGYKEADTVRITWPNGLIQNEIHQAANQQYTYKEAQRLSGSCPMIWTWDGHEFQFLTDVLGIAPLGASSGDASYFPVDHDEYVQLPAGALSEKDGALEIRMTEELSEVSYIDQLRLYALDHRQGEEVFVNEKWKGPPFPEFRFYGARRRVYPVDARDDRQHDVLAKLLKIDRQYPNDFARTESGIAELHSLTLDFGDAAKGNRAVMILNGWVDWADGSTFMAAAQESKAGLIPPYLQVKDTNGAWRTVIEDMGMPDGKPKTIAVDLTGKFLTADRHVRIVTNICVYWDEIFLSESSAMPDVRQTAVPVLSAEVRFRGFSASRIDAERKQPEQFFYAISTPLSYWNPTPGKYTRYGDVRDLLAEVDDRYVVMGSGDEIRLRLNARALPAVAAGWTREYLLKVDGWAKDRDANTAFSQSVEPLPFHAMSAYPYSPAEHYPRDREHLAYLREYNTRLALRLIRPLRNGSLTVAAPKQLEP
jgi:tetratricopeptide (TPR) repeat protein